MRVLVISSIMVGNCGLFGTDSSLISKILTKKYAKVEITSGSIFSEKD
jgi:hypothetical protein